MVILGMYYGIGFTTLKHFFQLRSQEGFARAHLLDDTFALWTLRGVPKILAQAGWFSRKHPKILRIDGFSFTQIWYDRLRISLNCCNSHPDLGNRGFTAHETSGAAKNQIPRLLHQALSEHGTGLFPVVFPGSEMMCEPGNRTAAARNGTSIHFWSRTPHSPYSRVRWQIPKKAATLRVQQNGVLSINFRFKKWAVALA